jgi:hypothetical protein
MVIDKFHWLREMITIGDHHFRIVMIDSYYYWFAIRKWVDIGTIYNGTYPQKTQ